MPNLSDRPARPCLELAPEASHLTPHHEIRPRRSRAPRWMAATIGSALVAVVAARVRHPSTCLGRTQYRRAGGPPDAGSDRRVLRLGIQQLVRGLSRLVRTGVRSSTEMNEPFQPGSKAMTVGAVRAMLSMVLLVACTGSLPADERSETRAVPSNVDGMDGQGTATQAPRATNSPGTDARSGETGQQHRPESCGLQDEPPTGTFEDVSGWIAYRCGSTIVAVDPENPPLSLSLGSVHGCPSGPHYAGHCQGADPIDWSADGTGLLLSVVFRRGLGSDLWVMHADGSTKRVTTHEDAGWGSFSPDGSKIAYGCCGDRPGPYVIDADGGRSRSLRHPCPSLCGEPLNEAAAWSPQGSRIAWVDFEENSKTYGHHAYVLSFVSPDGTGVRTEVAPLPGGGGPRLVARRLPARVLERRRRGVLVQQRPALG